MKRTGRLRSKSLKKQYDPREKLYTRAVAAARKAEGKTGPGWQSHHPNPPHSKDLLFFVLIPTELHDRITSSAKWARAEGWLNEVNGQFSKWRPEVLRALERREELLKELENPKLSGA